MAARATRVVAGLVVLGCAAGLAAGLGGCASGPAGPGPAVVARAADCRAPQVIAGLGLQVTTAPSTASSSAHPDAPEAGTVPDGFEPVAAVACLTGETLSDTAGQWAAVTERRLEGDLAPLLAAVREPGVPDPACTAPAGLELWLEDALGAAVRVALPAAGCGEVAEEVTAAITGLTVVDETAYPIELVAARPTGDG